VFLFPHLADVVLRGSDPGKIVPLPVAYDERMFYPEQKERGTVVRATAGLGSKDIDSFLEVARACPEGRFTLITSRPKEDSSYLSNLVGRNSSVGSPVKILIEVPRGEAATIVRKSEICFRSNNPNGHPFGMPISIAESMGSGTIPVVRDHAPGRGYVGAAGLYFSTIQQAVDGIRAILSDQTLSDRLSAAAVERAKPYASSVVLPKMLEVWEAAGKSK
jgi:glycosyltransferase involved in cell wall biosynthesis